MRLSWLLSLPTFLSTASALAIERRDADFYSVRTHLTKDMSGRRGDHKDKYFRESLIEHWFLVFNHCVIQHHLVWDRDFSIVACSIDFD